MSELSWSGLLGYLNFSEGKPDPRFQAQLNEAFRLCAEAQSERPWQALKVRLEAELEALIQQGSAAFRDPGQARAVLSLTFDRLLPAYREHHRDPLAHLDDRDLFGPFFLARAFEAVLAQGGPWDAGQRITRAALGRLNDFVGHRPIAILETRQQGEPYAHERVRPVPLYLRGAGVAWGRYRELIEPALSILQRTDPAILVEGHLDLELLDEWAVDPRAYDFCHPVNRRPNYVFGEWDPHHLDNEGRYRRFVSRQVILEALREWVERGDGSPEERRFEAAAVLAGVTLMAAGISGWGPAAHGAEATLAERMPPVARCRDAFYEQLLKSASGPHGERLRHEALRTKQPFGGVRQHLNQYLARARAFQLQQRRLSLLFAHLGYADAAEQEAAKLDTASTRFLSAAHVALATAARDLAGPNLEAAANRLAQVEELLDRGIACGALADPWNALGFQGQFPLSAAREDSVADTRLHELIELLAGHFAAYGRLLGEAAARGQRPFLKRARAAMRKRARWWDRFATFEVSGLRRLQGAEEVESAEQVAAVLARWHAHADDRGREGKSADPAFWREHVSGFRSPRAFALVVAGLLDRGDQKTALALLIAWVSRFRELPLEEGEHSFYVLAHRWLNAVPASDAPLIQRFFDLLEVNAEQLWNMAPDDDEDDLPESDDQDLFGAAYEEVTYRDSADDQQEGEVLGGGPLTREYILEAEAEDMSQQYRFLAAVAGLWRRAANRLRDRADSAIGRMVEPWLAQMRRNQAGLLEMLDTIQALPIPQPLGSQDTIMEYDRRLGLKAHILELVIHTCLATDAAARAVRCLMGDTSAVSGRPWEAPLVRLEMAARRSDLDAVRGELTLCLESLEQEPITFAPIAEGGQARQVLRSRSALEALHYLAEILPPFGLFREALELLQAAWRMQANVAAPGRRVTEFNALFDSAYQGIVQAAITAVNREAVPAAELVSFLEGVSEPFLKLWLDQSRFMRLSELERIAGEKEWEQVRQFIQRYGRDLFHARFMTQANLRGIVHHGVGRYLDDLAENADPLRPVRLIEELGQAISREQAAALLELILRALIENYEDYRDYNTTVAASDYGENLHILFDFLRLKSAYARQEWQFRPLLQAHELLARAAARTADPEPMRLWQEGFDQVAHPLADQFEAELRKLEEKHGVRLAGVADRLAERFVRPLTLARWIALVEPAMEASEQTAPAVFTRLREGIASLAGSPAGPGLEAPVWLQRLEQEMERVRSSKGEASGEARPVALSFRALRQMWQRPDDR